MLVEAKEYDDVFSKVLVLGILMRVVEFEVRTNENETERERERERETNINEIEFVSKY